MTFQLRKKSGGKLRKPLQDRAPTQDRPCQIPMCFRSDIRIMVIDPPAHACREPITPTAID